MTLVWQLGGHWKRAQLREVLQLVKLGYLRGQLWFGPSPSPWTRWFDRVSIPADTPIILQELDGSPQLLALMSVIAKEKVPMSAWPILRRSWEQVTPEVDPGHIHSLLQAMGQTGAPAALTFLSEQLQVSRATGPAKDLYRSISSGLIAWSERKDTPEVRAALRAAVRIRLDSDKRQATNDTRRTLMARLLELGDLDAVRMIPDLEARGNSRLENLLVDSWKGQQRETFHGFDAAGLAEAWGVLLDRDERFWSQIMGILQLGSNITKAQGVLLGNHFRVREPVARVVFEKLQRHVSELMKSGAPITGGRQHALGHVLVLPGRCSSLTPELETAIHRLTTRCLASSVPSLQTIALAVLYAEEVRPEQRPIVIQTACGSAESTALRAMHVIVRWIKLSAAEFRTVVDKATPRVRTEFLARYLPGWDGRAVAASLPFVEDAESDVRVSVCSYLGRCADPRAVAPLLKVLRDPDKSVREAAEQALRSIRFYHEQKAHWDRAFQGPQLSANSAAEALLQQAGKGEKNDIRLLAIRSLGLLGKVETLPFLISYSKEANAAIATAARKAIETVQEKAARDK